MSTHRASVVILSMLSSIASYSVGQTCEPELLSTGTFPGVAGSVYTTTMWDPDGPGPLQPHLVAGGLFTVAGGIAASNVAMLNLETGTWSALAGGVNDAVRALTVLPTGELVVGGEFSAPAASVALWNGTAWSSLGTGMNNDVLALTYMPGYGLIAGGIFGTAGGNPIPKIARWDGAAWTTVGAGVTGNVFSLVTLPTGDVVAGGPGSYVDGVFYRGAVRWDGTQWHGMTGLEASVSSIAVLPDGTMIAGGVTSSQTDTSVFRSSGDTWTTMGTPIAGKYPGIYAVGALPDGQMFVGGWFPFSNGDQWARAVYRWNGGDWAETATYDGGVYHFGALPDGSMVIGGSFKMTGPGFGIGHYANEEWSSFGRGLNGTATAVCARADGTFVAGGTFTSDGENRIYNLGSWNGVEWSSVAPDFSGTPTAIVELPNGDVVVAGEVFARNNGVTIRNIVRWDGTQWNAFNGSFIGVRGMVVAPNGDIVIGGSFTGSNGRNRIARWNGIEWLPLGTGFNAAVNDVAVTPEGDVIAVGEFAQAGSVPVQRVARWDGTQWSAMGAGFTNVVNGVTVTPDGTIYVAGYGLYRWDGSSWITVGNFNGVANDVVVLPNGDIVVAGVFTTVGGINGLAVNRVARWDGTTWSAFGSGLNNRAHKVASAADGGFMVVGEFSTANGKVSPFATRWNSTGAPMISGHPESMVIHADENVELTAIPTSDIEGVSVQWYRDDVAIVDGLGGASDGGGVVLGASAVLESPTNGTPVTLTIFGAQASDSGVYTARFVNDCGEAITEPAVVQILCLADFDASGFVDTDDFSTFVMAFEAGDPSADVDDTGFVDTDDFDTFVMRFEAGC